MADAVVHWVARCGQQGRIQEVGWRSRVCRYHPEEPKRKATEACAEGYGPEPEIAAGCETLISEVFHY